MNDREIARKLTEEQSVLHVTPQMRRRLDLCFSEPKRHVVPRRMIIIALGLLLFAACAYAVELRLGILDFIGQFSGRLLPNDAQQYISEDIAIFSDEEGMFSVHLRQMAFDGSTVFAVMDILPESDSVLITPADARMDDPVSNLKLERDGTLQEYCQSNGYKDAWRASVSLSSELASHVASIDGAWREEGQYTLYVAAQLAQSAEAAEGALEITLTHHVEGKKICIPCAFSLTKAAAESVIGKSVAIPVERAGITIDRIEVEKRTFETWFSVYYTIANEETYGSFPMGVEFRVLDEHGKALPAGASGQGSTERMRQRDGSVGAMYRSRQSIYVPALPRQVSMEVFCPGEAGVLDRLMIELE